MSTALGEKRKFVRLDYAVPVTVAIRENDKTVYLQGFSRNISYGGMGIEVKLATLHGNIDLISVANKVEIEVELPHNNPSVHLSGFIRWRQCNYNETKILFGIEFTDPCDKVAVTTLYNYAKWERKRKVLTKRWFLLSVVGLIGLSIWGVDLSLDNYYLIKRINRLDSMRVEMEQNLMALRQQKFTLDTKLDHAYEENQELRHDLESLRKKTNDLNANVTGLIDKLASSAGDSQFVQQTEIARLKELIEQKNELNAELQDQISFIQRELAENEQMLARIGAKSQEITNAFYNRFKTKKMLDQEIADLSKKTGMANIAASGYTSLPRSMWVNNQEIFKFQSKTDELLDFCKDRNINLIFARIDMDASLTPHQFPNFLKKAHEQGVAVHAFFKMSSKKSADRNRKASSSFVAQIVAYNKSQPKEACFDGVNIWLEPGLTASAMHEASCEYLDGFKKLVAGRDKARFPLHIGVTVPGSFEADRLVFTYNNKSESLNTHLLDVVDYMTVSGDCAPDAVHYASQYGKKVYVSQPLSVLDNVDYDSTMSGHVIHDMETDIRETIEKYLDKPGFMGVAVGSYGDYKQCIEDNTPEYVKRDRQQIISVRPPKIDYKGPVMSGSGR